VCASMNHASSASSAPVHLPELPPLPPASTTGSGHRGSGHCPANAPPPRPPPTGYPRRLRPGPSLPPHPDIVDTRSDPTVPHPLFSDAVGVVFRCWVPTSRCRARLTPRSPPTRTRRALFGRHAAADGLRRIISGLAGFVRTAGANSILHSARMILSDVLTCTVPPCVSSLPY